VLFRYRHTEWRDTQKSRRELHPISALTGTLANVHSGGLPDFQGGLRRGLPLALEVIGGNWVELYLSEDDFGGAFDQRAAAQAIAAEVVANVLP
jgi:hypothetical protein